MIDELNARSGSRNAVLVNGPVQHKADRAHFVPMDAADNIQLSVFCESYPCCSVDLFVYF